MARDNQDNSILHRINQRVREEGHLYRQDKLSLDDQQRLSTLKVELDQCWGLLRQRRALREFGKDPDTAKVRPKNMVENYGQ